MGHQSVLTAIILSTQLEHNGALLSENNATPLGVSNIRRRSHRHSAPPLLLTVTTHDLFKRRHKHKHKADLMQPGQMTYIRPPHTIRT